VQIPIFRWKGNAPKPRSGLKECKGDFGLSVRLLPNSDDFARQILTGFTILNLQELAWKHCLFQQDKSAMSGDDLSSSAFE